MRTIRIYTPDENPVASDAPGWLACSEKSDGTPVSRNGTDAVLAIAALLYELEGDW
jgi:hypothetical protein